MNRGTIGTVLQKCSNKKPINMGNFKEIRTLLGLSTILMKPAKPDAKKKFSMFMWLVEGYPKSKTCTFPIEFSPVTRTLH